jgi:hypothetical protein
MSADAELKNFMYQFLSTLLWLSGESDSAGGRGMASPLQINHIFRIP